MKNQPFKQVFDRVYPTKEEEQKAIAFVQLCIDQGYEYYMEHRNDKGAGTLLMKFYMLPKTELHAQFNTKIIVEYQNKIRREQERLLQDHLAKKQREFSYSELFRSSPSGGEYVYINKVATDVDEHLRVGIPYKKGERQDFFNYYGVTVISMSKTPKLFLQYLEQ